MKEPGSVGLEKGNGKKQGLDLLKRKRSSFRNHEGSNWISSADAGTTLNLVFCSFGMPSIICACLLVFRLPVRINNSRMAYLCACTLVRAYTIPGKVLAQLVGLHCKI